MKLYFSTRQIPPLRDLPLKERMAALEQAAFKMTVPERSLLNVLKLLVIVPVFIFILQSTDDWTALLWAALVFLTYPLFVKPLQYSLSAKYLPETKQEPS
ncbi:DUF6170 family protein [Alteromonas oceanisediminis]|uniref:DUF6170 family protein n=1 Tax=Alteromonas oceanisediminis TaxID=2836180 RepID=UPI001BD91697|nr:DUF6170 family protein [Alteromonas oceanisediminis]MBT0585066.1 hypothetical protein [Alteromonas oceanisediminis]